MRIYVDSVCRLPLQRQYLSAPQTPNYAKGKLTKVTSSVSATEYQLFDNLGRMTQMSQITDGRSFTSKYTYNFSGAMIEEEYPSGRKVKNEFESDGDLLKVTSQKNPSAVYMPYASNFSYTASGEISQTNLAADGCPRGLLTGRSIYYSKYLKRSQPVCGEHKCGKKAGLPRIRGKVAERKFLHLEGRFNIGQCLCGFWRIGGVKEKC